MKTVETAFEVIRALETLDGAGVTELANHLDMSKSTTHNHLATLHQREVVVKRADQYELGLQFLLLGEYVRNQNVLYEHGKKRFRNSPNRPGNTQTSSLKNTGSASTSTKYEGRTPSVADTRPPNCNTRTIYIAPPPEKRSWRTYPVNRYTTSSIDTVSQNRRRIRSRLAKRSSRNSATFAKHVEDKDA